MRARQRRCQEATQEDAHGEKFAREGLYLKGSNAPHGKCVHKRKIKGSDFDWSFNTVSSNHQYIHYVHYHPQHPHIATQ
jgi:hypothetical protein